MKPLPATPELLAVAQRVVWFKTPSAALADPVHFLAHVMTYGTVKDLRALEGFAGDREFREALEHAPPGIFDPRSWAYWNMKFGRVPVPPLPVRRGVQSRGPLVAGVQLRASCYMRGDDQQQFSVFSHVTPELVEQVRRIQAPIIEGGRSYDFSEDGLDSLRCVTRLAVEFADYLQRLELQAVDDETLKYTCESIFLGIDSYFIVNDSWRVMTGEVRSSPVMEGTSMTLLKETFTSKYREFLSETSFEKRCRLLLELFKLQIIFAGLSYG